MINNSLTSKVLLALCLIFAAHNVKSQIKCNEATNISNSSPYSLLPQICDTSFSGTSKKYKYQSFFVPTLADPVITVKIVVHVFTPITNDVHAFNNGTGYYNNLAALKRRYAGICTDPAGGTAGQKTDRYSKPRQANYTVPNLNISSIADSRIQFEVVAYYFYSSNQYYYGTLNGLPSEPQYLDSAQTIPNPSYNPKKYNQDSAMNYINRNFPSRLGEGLPIVMMSSGQAMKTYNIAAAGKIPFMTIEHYAGDSNASEIGNNGFAVWQLRHELGHCFGLLHAYYGKPCFTGSGSPSLETFNSSAGKLDCNNIDYLSDLFPSNNPNATANSYPLPTSCPMPYKSLCNSVYEAGDTALHNSVYTNNIMTDNVAFIGSPGGFTWMSPLQMGRRIRSMHFKSDAYDWRGVADWGNIRYYAKEARSEKLYPLVIDSNETWAFDIQMYKDIVIKKDRTLTIKCKVSMATDGRIIVEKGGKLIIDGGEVTGWCKKTPVNSYKNSPLWFGVEVRGSTNQNQLINNSTGYCPNQGIVEIKNNGTISYAQNGIYTGYSWAGVLFPSGNSGGIVIANNANFINNVFDILFFKFAQSPTRNKLINCRFLTTGEIGRDGNGTLIKPEEHVKLFENYGLYFDNCVFENTSTVYSYFTSGTGISSYNSNFNVGFNGSSALPSATKCTFKNLMVGIRIDNSNPLATANIKYNDFTYNTYKAIIAENVYNLDISENIFKTENTEVGVYAYQCKYYKIRNNYFVSPRSYESTGIGVYSSGAGAHSLYRNSFSKLMYSIIAMDNNGTVAENGLKMNCNNFVPLVNCCDNKWDIAVTKSGVMPTIDPNQGVSGGPKTLVRNIYHANYFSSTVRNKFFVDPSNT